MFNIEPARTRAPRRSSQPTGPHRGRSRLGATDDGSDDRAGARDSASQRREAPPIIVGRSAAIRAVLRQAERFAGSEAPVLVGGETGTGKDLVARQLHALSSRADGPFVAVNCGAIPSNLIESELFGCEPGAFTGARKRLGYVAEAQGGTLFLDEVGELSAAAQAALLRVLESGEVRPIGGDASRRIDFRLIAATHRDLADAAQKGAFREDLYHRLAVLMITLPPLRERLVDIAELATAVMRGSSACLGPTAIEALRRHRWPGNVRELRNVLLRAAALAEGREIGAEHIYIARPSAEARHDGTVRWRGKTLDEIVQSCIVAVVADHHNNVRAAARTLDISPTTIYRHLRLLEMQSRASEACECSELAA